MRLSIDERVDLITIAAKLGSILPAPSGNVVKKLSPTDAAKATTRTLSEQHGKGAFPLHTDTAFWPVPARYLVFRVRGDTRRHTIVLSFKRLLEEITDYMMELVERSVWIARTPSKSIYCSFRFTHDGVRGYRFDENCMKPANEAASELSAHLREWQQFVEPDTVDWSSGGVLVVDNWNVLHGRGPEPPDENERILERVYVGGR